MMPFDYEIIIEDHLDPHWSEWLDEMMIERLESDETRLSGRLLDQAALYGLLIKINNLGLQLISVKRLHRSATNHF